MAGSLAEEGEQQHDHLQALVYHLHPQESPGVVGCEAVALQYWGDLEDEHPDDQPGEAGWNQGEVAVAGRSVSELSLPLPAGAPQEWGCSTMLELHPNCSVAQHHPSHPRPPRRCSQSQGASC